MIVIGAGTMGSGIAIAALDAGFDVMLLEQDEAALQRGATRIHEHYAGRVARGQGEGRLRLPPARRGCAPATDWSAMSEADMVIEAVFEDLAVKQACVSAHRRIARPGAVLARTRRTWIWTRSPPPLRGRRTCSGLHFFSPANVMRLLEVVRGGKTAPDALATGLDVAKRLTQAAGLTSNAFGFVGNRIYSAYRRQCEFMIEEGALPEQVDAALEAFGFAMGPFAVADMSGLDIAWRMRKSQAATRDPAARYVKIRGPAVRGRAPGAQDRRRLLPLRDERRQERATAGSARARHHRVRQRGRQGHRPRATSPTRRSSRRALLAMVNEAALLLGEGVAQRATDVDVVLVNGYGFPRWEGGPVFWARDRGEQALQADLDWLAEVSGPGFVRGDLRHVLVKERMRCMPPRSSLDTPPIFASSRCPRRYCTTRSAR